jgi:hypothetical protein
MQGAATTGKGTANMSSFSIWLVFAGKAPANFDPFAGYVRL